MSATSAVHECLFCPQTFGSAAEKDDHTLEHFAQETCAECNQSLIRIGGNLYTIHNAVTCIRINPKSEKHIAEDVTRVKTESSNTNECNQRVPLNVLPPREMPPLVPIIMPPLVSIRDIHYSEPMPMESIHLEELIIKPEPGDSNENQDKSQFKQPQLSATFQANKKKGEPNACDICGQIYARSDSLRYHKIRKHSAPGTHFCSICCRIFDTKQESIKHIAICQSKRDKRNKFRKCKNMNAVYECYLCRKQCPRHTALLGHFRFSHGACKSKCKICGKGFCSKGMLEEHQRFHCVNSVHRKFECGICEKSFKTRHDLRKHVNRHNQENRQFKCLLQGCEEYFLVARERDEHMQTHTCKTTDQSNEEQQSSDWSSDEEQLQDVCPVVTDPIKEVESQIKTEPKFEWSLDQSQVQYIEQSKGMASTSFGATSLNTTTEDIFVPDFALGEIIGLQSSEQLPSETGSNPIEIMAEDTLKSPASSVKQQSKRKRNIPVECDVCGKILSVKSSLDRHKLLMHSAPSTHFCRYCNKIFTTADELSTHVPECYRQKKGGPFTCNICNKTLQSCDSFRSHMKFKHNPDMKFKCGMCSAQFWKKAALESHSKLHEKGLQFACDICRMVYSRSDTLKHHKIRAHGKPGTYYCTFCCHVFSSEKEVTEHKLICRLKMEKQRECRKNKDKNATYECYICRKHCPSHSALQAHFRFKHSSDAIRFKCNICKKGYSMQFALDKHMKRHNQPLNDRKFMCTVCGKYVGTNDALKNHMNIHTGERPYKCPHDGCEKTFRLPTTRDEHVRSHTGEKPFHCTIDGCEKRFSYATDFRRHKFKIHGVIRTKFTCSICSDVFPDNTLLKAHMKKHNV